MFSVFARPSFQSCVGGPCLIFTATGIARFRLKPEDGTNLLSCLHFRLSFLIGYGAPKLETILWHFISGRFVLLSLSLIMPPR